MTRTDDEDRALGASLMDALAAFKAQRDRREREARELLDRALAARAASEGAATTDTEAK